MILYGWMAVGSFFVLCVHQSNRCSSPKAWRLSLPRSLARRPWRWKWAWTPGRCSGWGRGCCCTLGPSTAWNGRGASTPWRSTSWLSPTGASTAASHSTIARKPSSLWSVSVHSVCFANALLTSVYQPHSPRKKNQPQPNIHTLSHHLSNSPFQLLTLLSGSISVFEIQTGIAIHCWRLFTYHQSQHPSPLSHCLSLLSISITLSIFWKQTSNPCLRVIRVKGFGCGMWQILTGDWLNIQNSIRVRAFYVCSRLRCQHKLWCLKPKEVLIM